MTTSSKPLAVVTGASSGIGYELARQFAEHGYDLMICSQQDRIAEAARNLSNNGTLVQTVQADLSTREGVDKLYRRIQQ